MGGRLGQTTRKQAESRVYTVISPTSSFLSQKVVPG